MRSSGQFQTFLLIFFFYEKILHAQKAQKAQTAQRRDQAKAQKVKNANK